MISARFNALTIHLSRRSFNEGGTNYAATAQDVRSDAVAVGLITRHCMIF